MAGYDPKAKRAHSPSAPDRRAPVDDLLGPPAAPVAEPEPAIVGPVTEPAPNPTDARPAPRPAARPLAPTPAAASGPDPKVLAAVLAAVVAVLLFWRHRRH